MNNYVCKVATLSNIIEKWDNEIKENPSDNSIKIWKEKFISSYKMKKRICYYGYLNGEVITEGSVIISEDDTPYGDKLIDKHTGYLVSFKTKEAYQGLGYFSKLYKFMEDDLRKRGYTKLTIGVEPNETKNRAIYAKWGFNNYIMQAAETYPDGQEVKIDFYSKYL